MNVRNVLPTPEYTFYVFICIYQYLYVYAVTTYRIAVFEENPFKRQIINDVWTRNPAFEFPRHTYIILFTEKKNGVRWYLYYSSVVLYMFTCVHRFELTCSILDLRTRKMSFSRSVV